MFGYVKFFKQTPLLITHPSVFKLLLLFPQQLFIQADRVPASHDVVGDDTAQRVGHNGDFPSFLLKLWVPRAEQCVQAVQFLLQPLDKLFEGGKGRRFNNNVSYCSCSHSAYISLLSMHVGQASCSVCVTGKISQTAFGSL